MADKTTSLKILIEAEVQKALQDMGALDQSVEDLAQSATALNKDLGQTEAAANDAAADLKSLGKEAESVDDLFRKFGGQGARSIAAIEKEADEARAAFKRLEASGEHSLEEIARAGKLLDKRLNDLEKEIKDVDDAAGKIDGNGFRELLSQIGAVAAATAGLQQALAAVGEYAEFEDDLLAVKALANASEVEFQRLKTAAFELAGAAGGPKAIAAAMGELAASGADVDEILSNVDLVGKLSGASRGALNFKDSGDLLTNTIKQLRLGMDAAVPVADRLAKGWNTAGHDGAELGDALAQVLPVATELYGHLGDTAPLEKSVAVINVLAETYKKGSEGGNAYLMMLRALAKPVGEGAAALEKYKDQVTVFDETGRIRDFADIIDDLAAAQMSTTDQLAIFGEAWPGVTALIGAGGDAIRKMEADVKAADGTVGATSDTLQGGLGGALREATAEIEKARLSLVEDFLPALQGVLSLAKYADNAVAGLSGTIKTGAAVWSASAGGITRYLSLLEDVTDFIGVTDDATNSLRQTSDAFLASANDLGNQASASFKKARGQVDPLAESQKQLASTTSALKQEYANISRVTGVTVTSMKELDAAVAAGTIRQDEATGKWIGTEKEKQEAIADTVRAAEEAAKKTAEADKAARKEAEKAWNDYLKTVTSITDQLTERSGILGLEEELADLKATQLSAAEGYQQIKDRVSELGAAAKSAFEEAEKLTEAGKNEEAAAAYEKALEYADEAKEKAKELNGEVAEGDKVIVSQKEAYETAKTAVTEYGELGIEILEKWKEASQEAADTLDNEFNFSGLNESAKAAAEEAGKIGPAISDGVESGVDAAIPQVSRLDDAITEMARDRTARITIEERTVQAALHGAQIMGRDLRAGAMVSGPVGYDSVHAILAGREAVTRNKIVDELGYDETFRPLNQGRYDIVMKRLAAFHGPDETREILAAYLRPPEVTMPLLPEMPRLDPSAQGGTSGRDDLPKLGTIVWEIGNTSVPVQIRTDHAALVQQELAKIKKGDQLKARAQGRAR